MQIVKLPALREVRWQDFLPTLAPLPEAFVSHLYATPGALTLPRSPEPLVDQIWQQIQRARQLTSYLLLPAVDTMQDKVDVDWFRRNWQAFAKQDRLLPRTTSDEWVRKHLLRSLSFGALEPNSVAALFMMRYLVLKDYRLWLPKRQKANAPWFYVWGLQPDDQIPRVYPYPLPDDLPANTLLWSQWIGASWLPGWMRVPGIGALAWSKTTTVGDRWYWDISENELARWDHQLVRDASVARRSEILEAIYQSQSARSYPDVRQRYQRTRLHDLATLVLQQVGEPILAGCVQHYYTSDKSPTQPYRSF